MKCALAIAFAALAVAAAGCGGGDEAAQGSVDESQPYFQADEGLFAPRLVRVRPSGELGDPTPGLTTSDTEANAVVTLGEGVEEGATLAVAWYRLAHGGREPLFTHEIEVAEHGRARSQALARGGLPPGLYETVATLGDRQTRTLWAVVEGSSYSPGTDAQAAPSGIEAGEASFSAAPEPAAQPSPGARECTPEVERISVDMELSVSMSWKGPCDTITIGASVTGPPATLRTFSAPAQVNVIGTLQDYQSATTGPCDVPGGSDLPGTTFRAVVTDSGGAVARGEETLEDRGPLLMAVLESTPPNGSRVRGGDTIELSAGAILLPPALGVEELTVTAGGQTLGSTGNKSGSTEPRPCDLGRIFAELHSEYQVPADPPAVVQICARAVGFDGTTAEQCAQFPTGDQEIWEGTWEGGWHVPAPCTPEIWDSSGPVALTVAADGTATGLVRLTNHTGVCGGTDVPRRVPAPTQISGRKTESGFTLDFVVPGGGSRRFELTRTGNDARGRLAIASGVGRYEAEIELRCVSCG